MKESKNIFDFHIHTKYSYDSLISLKSLVRIAEKKGLKGMRQPGFQCEKLNDVSISWSYNSHEEMANESTLTMIWGEKPTIIECGIF